MAKNIDMRPYKNDFYKSKTILSPEEQEEFDKEMAAEMRADTYEREQREKWRADCRKQAKIEESRIEQEYYDSIARASWDKDNDNANSHSRNDEKRNKENNNPLKEDDFVDFLVDAYYAGIL